MSPAERARKISALVLQRAQRDATQVALAAAMGVSESTVSRMLAPESLDKLALMLAHVGLKVVPLERVCVDRQMFDAMSCIASRAMADEAVAQRLTWEDE
jgi:hypothetical protein